MSGEGAARRRVTSGSPYEAIFGFARAVREGNRIIVAGTGPVEPDGSTTPGDAAAQATRVCTIIVAAIEAGTVWGCQFHPEKSGANGLRILQNDFRLFIFV